MPDCVPDEFEAYFKKLELLSCCLANDQFRQKAQGIVEDFTALQDQPHRRRCAMEKQWKESEEQIERVIASTVGMYGEMQGIVGAGPP